MPWNKTWKKLKCSSLLRVWLFPTPWTVAHQAPLPMGFSRQEYWSGLPSPSPGESSWPRDWTQVSCIASIFFTIWVTKEAANLASSQISIKWLLLFLRGWGRYPDIALGMSGAQMRTYLANKISSCCGLDRAYYFSFQGIGSLSFLNQNDLSATFCFPIPPGSGQKLLPQLSNFWSFPSKLIFSSWISHNTPLYFLHLSSVAFILFYLEKIIIWKGTCPFVHSSTAYSSQVMEAASLFMNRWMDEEYIYLSLYIGSIYINRGFIHIYGLPRWHSGEESACQYRGHRRCKFDLWVGKIPWSR